MCGVCARACVLGAGAVLKCACVCALHSGHLEAEWILCVCVIYIGPTENLSIGRILCVWIFLREEIMNSLVLVNVKCSIYTLCSWELSRSLNILGQTGQVHATRFPHYRYLFCSLPGLHPAVKQEPGSHILVTNPSTKANLIPRSLLERSCVNKSTVVVSVAVV